MLPTWLLPPTVALAMWATGFGIGAGNVWAEIVPGAVVAAFALAAYALWERRGQPWHDPLVIVLLLPALAASVWLTVGGLVLDVARTTAGRLFIEVGPGVGLTGLVCTVIAFYGHHHPDERRLPERPRRKPAR